MSEKRRKVFSKIALLLSVILVLYITLISRKPLSSREPIFQPFYSYMQIICRGEYGRLKENLLNIALFIPIGLCCRSCVNQSELGKKWLISVCTGFLLSLFVEVAQLIFKLGFFETDDLINNTLGALIGCVIYVLLQHIRIKDSRDN